MTSSQEVLVGMAQVLVSCLKAYNDDIKAMYGIFSFCLDVIKSIMFCFYWLLQLHMLQAGTSLFEYYK